MNPLERIEIRTIDETSFLILEKPEIVITCKSKDEAKLQQLIEIEKKWETNEMTKCIVCGSDKTRSVTDLLGHVFFVCDNCFMRWNN